MIGCGDGERQRAAGERHAVSISRLPSSARNRSASGDSAAASTSQASVEEAAWIDHAAATFHCHRPFAASCLLARGRTVGWTVVTAPPHSPLTEPPL